MESLPGAGDDDPFADSDEWIAAQARQLFRARSAEDEKAVEVAMFYLEHYLTLTLRRHLRGKASSWDGMGRWLDGLSEKRVEYPWPGGVRIQAVVTWVVGQEHWYDDPFEFELELCPRNGAFGGYAFRFGDHLPLSAKGMGRAVSVPPPGGWAFEFRRGSAEQIAARDRGRHPGSARNEGHAGGHGT
jgi:hypothetical protein